MHRRSLLYNLLKQEREAFRESSIHGQKMSDRDTQLIATGCGGLGEGNKYLIPLVVAGTILTVAGLGHYVDLNSFSDSAVKFLSDAGPYGYAYFAAVTMISWCGHCRLLCHSP